MSLATIAAASGEEIVPFDLPRAQKPLFQALMEARAKFGGKRIALIDGDERQLSYDELVRAVLALGSALRKGTRSGEAVGVMLPTGAGSVIAFFALSAYGRIPAMLNFTAGAAAVQAAMNMAKIKRVVTARRFVELGKFEALIGELASSAQIVYLEDVRTDLSLRDKVAAGIGQHLPALVTSRPAHGAPAVYLFTSGTEGEPKGVALSHMNLLANVEQVRSHIALYPHDVLFNPLPTFHCFGLTVGALMPLLLGHQGGVPSDSVPATRNLAPRSRDQVLRYCCRPILSFPNIRASMIRAICADCDSRSAAPSASATKHARLSAGNMAAWNFWKAMASQKPRPSSPPISPERTGRARSDA